MSNQATFQDLRTRLDLPLRKLAPLLRRPVSALGRYTSTKSDALDPPDIVIERMKALLRSKAFDDLEAAGATLDYVDFERSTSVNVEYIDFRYDPENEEGGRSAAREKNEEAEVKEKPCVQSSPSDELTVRGRILTLLTQRYLLEPRLTLVA
ncbi:hypothetical protein [Microvirga sp. P5_D2]